MVMICKEQETDWVRVLTKDKCESFTKTKTIILKWPACRFILYHVLKTEMFMKLKVRMFFSVSRSASL